MNDFTERYQKMSNSEVLQIISNAEDYQPLAVEAAKNEIERRGLSENELIKAYSKIELKRQVEHDKVDTRKEKEEQLKSKFYKFIDPIHPFKSDIPSYERTIRLIVIVFGLIAIYQLISGFDGFIYFFGSPESWDYSVLLFLISYLLLPTAIIYFWKRKRIGWILLLIYFIYSLSTIVALIVLAFQYQSSGFPLFDEILFPRISPSVYILPFLFYVGNIWVIFKKDIRKHYSIKFKKIF
jgi:hypothetical protein